MNLDPLSHVYDIVISLILETHRITAYNTQHCRSHRDDYFQNGIPKGSLDCHNFTHLLSDT